MRVIDAGKVPQDFQRQRDAATKALSFLKERHLTVKLSGRAEAPDGRRGRTLSSSARGAEPQAHYGPLQRLLEGTINRRPIGVLYFNATVPTVHGKAQKNDSAENQSLPYSDQGK